MCALCFSEQNVNTTGAHEHCFRVSMFTSRITLAGGNACHEISDPLQHQGNLGLVILVIMAVGSVIAKVEPTGYLLLNQGVVDTGF